MKNLGLTTKIMIGLILGVIFGLILNQFSDNVFVKEIIVNSFLDFIGGMFINLMRVMIVPLVSVSLAMGATAIGDIRKLRRIGTKIISFYLVTTAIAIIIGLVIATISGVGKGMSNTNLPLGEFKIAEKQQFSNVLLEMVPKNIVGAMVDEKMLAIIIFFLLLGGVMAALGDKVEILKKIIEEANTLVLKMVEVIMKLAPLGVFALISKTIATIGLDVIGKLIGYFFIVLLALFLHFGVYQIMLTTFVRISPKKFCKKFLKVMSVAFSTSSSGTTIPVTIECLTDDFGVSEEVSSFSIPLGATVNMDGTAIMQGVAAVFISNLYGITLGPVQYLGIIITAVLASIGTAAVPGAGMIMLSMVLNQAGLPVEGIGIIIGVDRLLDMTRTVINVSGDAICTMIVAKSENEIIDEEKFYS